MSAVDEAVAKILSMVPSPLISAADEVGIAVTGELLTLVDSMELSIEQILEEGEDILGTYHPMSSPGRITLNWQKIGSLFWRTLIRARQAGLIVEVRDLKRLAHLTAQKTYAHERFHFFCDVSRHLFGGHHDQSKEEALAVAASYHGISGTREQWNSSAGLVGEAPYRYFMQNLFAYSAPGYRDWVHYSRREVFNEGVIRYVISPPVRDYLMRSGVDLSPIIESIRRTLSNGSVVECIEP